MQRTEVDFSGKAQPESKTIAADGAQYYTYFPARKTGDEDTEPSGGEGIHVWDAASDKPLFDLPAPFASLALPVVAPGGKTLVAADAFNTVGIWDRHTGARLGTLYALQEGEWLLTTPSGLFDGSPRGWSEIAWREPGGGISTLPAEAFFNEFYRPGLLAELLDGRPPQPPRTITVVDRRQPKLAIASDEATTSQRTMNLHLSLSEAPADAQRNTGSGVRDVRLFRNGTLVRAWRGDLTLKSGRADLDETVKLVAGENRFVAYAFNRENVKSADAVVTIQSTAPARQGTAYILSIGVNQYTNPEFNLNFAAPDAQHLTQALTGHLQALGQYRQVVGVELLNEQATKANMLLALSILRGSDGGSLPVAAAPQLADLRPVQPEDMVVVYFAGHGVARRDRFYLVPHDLGYSGPRDEVLGSLDQLLKSSVSDLQLEQSFESIDAAHSLLIIDACNSGKVLDAEEQRRGPMNSKGLAQLAYEKGIYVLTASQAYQSAFESSRLGYGYLTFALAKEGLESAVADTRPIDGKVSAVEWFEYASHRVPEMQSEVLNRSVAGTVPAFERSHSSGNGQPAGLQTPRVYYRRDLPGGEAIVAKFP